MIFKTKIESAYRFVKNKLFLDKTGLVYDHIVVGREDEFPTPEEIARLFPNPCEYSTGMEDCMISGGTMIDVCLIKHERYGDELAAVFAKDLVKGLLKCAFSAKTEGFLPRGVCPSDEKSHYPDSSRDQYTIFAFALHRYINSPLCEDCEREEIARAAVAIARRAERNVIEKNGYDMLTDEGCATLVTVMWGDTLGFHEYMRLPMLYMLAYEASGDEHFLKKYREIREEAYLGSLKFSEVWSLYTLGQMQSSLRLCYDCESDAQWREKLHSLMCALAEHAESMAEKVRKKIDLSDNYNLHIPDFRTLPSTPAERFIKLGYENPLAPQYPDANEFFRLQDAAQIAITVGLVPNRMPSESAKAILAYGFSKIDLDKHERNLPVYFLQGFYRSINS